MPRQIKWLLIMAAGLAVFGLGQLGHSLATQPGGGEAHHAPPGAPPPPPPAAPPAPPPVVTAPGAVLRDLPLPPEKTVAGGCEPGGGPGTRAWREAESEYEWRSYNFDNIANNKIEEVKHRANVAMENIRWDIKRAQDRYHKADVEVNKYQNQKQRGTLLEDDFLKDAQQERQEALAELQRQKAREEARIEKVAAWRTQKEGEIWALRDRAKNGDYLGYSGLRNFKVILFTSVYE